VLVSGMGGTCLGDRLMRLKYCVINSPVFSHIRIPQACRLQVVGVKSVD